MCPFTLNCNERYSCIFKTVNIEEPIRNSRKARTRPLTFILTDMKLILPAENNLQPLLLEYL
jgi:hypothetical protein